MSSHTRPERVAIAVALIAWPLMVLTHLGLIDVGPLGPAATTDRPLLEGALWTGLAAAPGWALMAAAMMTPVALPAARHVAHNSLPSRRDRAVAWWLVAYLGLWTVFGVAAITGVALWNRGVAPAYSGLLLGASIGLAVAWQVSPAKRRLLGGCQRPVPLPARGWRATAGSLRFGAVYGLRCIGSCWAVMLVMAVATHGHLLWTLAIAALLIGERRVEAIRRAPWPVLASAGALALVLTVPAIASESSAVEGWFCRIASA